MPDIDPSQPPKLDLSKLTDEQRAVWTTLFDEAMRAVAEQYPERAKVLADVPNMHNYLRQNWMTAYMLGWYHEMPGDD